MKDELTRQLNGDEGRRAQAYQDHLGYWTIGVGRLVDPRKPGSGLRDSEMDFMLANDIDDRVAALTNALPWFADLDEARQGVLVNMSFQMGVQGLLGFTTTLALVRVGDFAGAAKNMMLSRWATQTPLRAMRMAEQMRTGVWQYAKGT